MSILFAAGSRLDIPVWTVVPFLLLLLAIAVFPLFAEHFWSKNRNKFLVGAILCAPVILYLYYLEYSSETPALGKLRHALTEYVDFIVLLGSLYAIAGGIYLQGSLRPGPFLNTGFLAIGAVLANFIGTTGASMLLIRPFLRINRLRRYRTHLPVFFIFVVSNLGGLLTPLGDPPLFLGFKRGVDFFWTLNLIGPWATANGMVLGVFLVWELMTFARESKGEPAPSFELAANEPLRIRGLHNVVFLAGIILAVLLQSDAIGVQLGLDRLTAWLSERTGQPLTMTSLVFPWGSVFLALMAVLSLATTPRDIRTQNDFSWGAMIEVAVLFLGIFIAMVPALAYLEHHGQSIPLHTSWQYFWVTGALSSFLDNAPTYLTFATIAAQDDSLTGLMRDQPQMLMAISAGAVFMGANSYIGNGPNFMVKAIADSMKFETPSFFGYMLYSGLILIPIFLIVTWLFFL